MKPEVCVMTKWKIDPDHSVAAFKVRHMMISNVRGQFNKLSGALDFNPENPDAAALIVAVDATGIYTGIGQRDDHLKSPEFLDVEKYPEITFQSSGSEIFGGKGSITGELTIHGITKTVTLEAEFFGPAKSPEDMGGETALGLKAKVKVNREDFGLVWNVPLDDGGVMVGNEVKIYLEIEADLEK